MAGERTEIRRKRGSPEQKVAVVAEKALKKSLFRKFNKFFWSVAQGRKSTGGKIRCAREMLERRNRHERGREEKLLGIGGASWQDN